MMTAEQIADRLQGSLAQLARTEGVPVEQVMLTLCAEALAARFVAAELQRIAERVRQ
jgi:hypothetical protein